MIEIIGYGMIVPAAVSIALVYVCRRWLPQSVSRRYALAVGLTTGFVVGYALLPSWAEWVPTRHWHWLPYLAVAAMIVGPIGFARGVWVVERWLISLILAIASACVLVPDWASLEPTRHLYVGFLSAYLFVLATCLPPLTDRLSPRLFLALLATVASILALMVLATVSLRYGHLAGLVASAMVGCCVSTFLFDDSVTLRSLAVRSLVPVFSILVGGCAFVGSIEPQPPLAGLLVLPASPLALWVVTWLPLPKDGRLASTVQVIAVAAILCVGIGWVLLAS